MFDFSMWWLTLLTEALANLRVRGVLVGKYYLWVLTSPRSILLLLCGSAPKFPRSYDRVPSDRLTKTNNLRYSTVVCGLSPAAVAAGVRLAGVGNQPKAGCGVASPVLATLQMLNLRTIINLSPCTVRAAHAAPIKVS